MFKQSCPVCDKSRPRPRPPPHLEMMALHGATTQELDNMTPDQQEMYYEQRLDSLEKENERIAKEKGYETVEEALAQPKEESFKPPSTTHTERARLQGAKILQTRYADQLLQHTPLRAAAPYEDDGVLEAILDRLPLAAVEEGYLARPKDDVTDDVLTASAFEVARLVQLVRDNNTLLLRLAIKLANCTFSAAARELARNVTAWDEDGDRDFELGDDICWCLHQDPTKDTFSELDGCITKLRSVALRVASLDVDAYRAVEPKILKPAEFQACSACDILFRLEELPGTWVSRFTEISAVQEEAEDTSAVADVNMDDTPEPEVDATARQRPSRLDSAVCSLVLVHQDGRPCRACAKHLESGEQHHCRQLCRKCNDLASDEFYDAKKKKRDTSAVLGLLPEDCEYCIYRQLGSVEGDDSEESPRSVISDGGNNLPSLDFLGRHDPDQGADTDDDAFSATDRSQSSGDEESSDDEDDDDDDDGGEDDGDGGDAPITSPLTRKRRTLSPALGQSPKKKTQPRSTSSGEKLGTATSVKKSSRMTAPPTTSATTEAAPLKLSDVHDEKTAKRYYADHIKKRLFVAYKKKRVPARKSAALNDVHRELATLQSMKDAGAAYWDQVVRDVQQFIADSEAKEAKKAQDVSQKKADKEGK